MIQKRRFFKIKPKNRSNSVRFGKHIRLQSCRNGRRCNHCCHVYGHGLFTINLHYDGHVWRGWRYFNGMHLHCLSNHNCRVVRQKKRHSYWHYYGWQWRGLVCFRAGRGQVDRSVWLEIRHVDLCVHHFAVCGVRSVAETFESHFECASA